MHRNREHEHLPPKVLDRLGHGPSLVIVHATCPTSCLCRAYSGGVTDFAAWHPVTFPPVNRR